MPVFSAGISAQDQKPQEGVVELEGVDLKQQIVRIQGYEGVNPLNLFIEPGTVVIWLNQYRGQVRVTFPEKKITLACRSPVNFNLTDEGYFVSNTIDFGGVASLCFVETGSFKYVIERFPAAQVSRTDGFRFEGKIVVK